MRKRWIFIAGALLLALPLVVSNEYYLHIANMTGIYMIVAVGLNLLTGYTGQLSIGQAAFFGIGAYTAALLSLKLHLSFWLAMPLAALTTAGFGVVMGIPTLKLHGPYLVMTTVGFAEIVRLVLINWQSVTRGTAGILNIPSPNLGGLKLDTEAKFYYLVLAIVALMILATYRLTRSKVGLAFKAIRENEIAAEAMGVPTTAYKIGAFALSALYAGVAGALYASLLTYISPDSFTFDDSVSFVSMIVVGGIGSIPGAVTGSVVLSVLPELLRAFKDFRLIIYGAILVGSVIAFPFGIVGFVESRLGRRPEGVSVWQVIFWKRKGSASISPD